MNSRYHAVYESWKSDPEGFWAAAAREIDWFKASDKVFDKDAGVYGRWFAGAECNTCHNAIDRHVDGGRADQIALIHDSAITGSQKKFTYGELKIEVEALAAVLRITASARVIASSSTCRWCRKRHSPCWPVRASARCIPWYLVGSPPGNWPPASTMRGQGL